MFRLTVRHLLHLILIWRSTRFFLGFFLFFLLYINDLPEVCEKGDILLYADDTTLVIKSSDKTNEDIVHESLNLENWFDQNHLTINDKKCMKLSFGTKKRNIKLLSKFEKVKGYDQCKYLGIIFDKNLNFSAHCKKITKQLSKFCGVVYKARKYFSKNQLIVFCNAYVKSVIEYGIIVYGSAAKHHLNSKLILQKLIMRAIFSK